MTQASVENDRSLLFLDVVDGVAVVGVNLPSLRERQAVVLRDRLQEIAEKSDGRLAVSMTDVIDLNSACINALVDVNKACHALGGHLMLFGLRPELRKSFRQTGVDKILPMADDCDRALKTFEKRRWSPFRSRPGRAA